MEVVHENPCKEILLEGPDMMERPTRKLASIRRIKSLEPIEGADLIVKAQIDGWQVVTAKENGFKVGDLVIYCEIDSFLPIKPEFEFLRKSSFKKMESQEGFRLKTIRLRGQLSQGLILPLTLLDPILVEGLEAEDQYGNLQLYKIAEGDDVSHLLGIIKYEKPIPAELAGKMKGDFPSFIPKTDEERIQNLDPEEIREKLNGDFLAVSEKLEGTSATYYMNNGEFGVCSRNIDLLETEGNTYWKVARELDLENKMRAYSLKHDFNFAIQGELIGEGIQKNHYRLQGHHLRVFSVYDITFQSYFDLRTQFEVTQELGLELVPYLDPIQHPFFPAIKLPSTVEEYVTLASEAGGGKSILNPDVLREGLVFRSDDRRVSFKAISNKYLENEKD